MTTTNQLVGITAQHDEIVKRISNGSLDGDRVRKALQDIIEGKFLEVVSGVSSWYVSPEQQLERVRQLNDERRWGFTEADFPSIPGGFTPRTHSEVLLLMVSLSDIVGKMGPQHTFDEFWGLIKAPEGYTKERLGLLKSDSLHLQPTSDHPYTPGVRWVAFDPMAFVDMEPRTGLSRLASGYRMAGAEILVAAVLFPDWVASWKGTTANPYPNLSGLQICWSDDRARWSHVPCLRLYSDDRRELGLTACMLDGGSDSKPGRTSASVREC